MHYTLGHSRTRVVAEIKSVFFFLLPAMKKDEQELKENIKSQILIGDKRNVFAD